MLVIIIVLYAQNRRKEHSFVETLFELAGLQLQQRKGIE